MARVLVQQVICRFGAPVAGISDRGKEVDGNLMARFVNFLTQWDCTHLNFKMRTTAYHIYSCNGAVERLQATLSAIMGRMIDEHQSDWDVMLPYVMAAYCASQHEVSKFTPNYLVLGREVRAPVDLVYGASQICETILGCQGHWASQRHDTEL